MDKNVTQLVSLLITVVSVVRRAIAVLTWVANAFDVVIDLLNGHTVSAETHFPETFRKRS